MMITDLLRLPDGRLDRARVEAVGEQVFRPIMQTLVAPSGNNAAVALNALALAAAAVIVSAGGPAERRRARAVFSEALGANQAALLEELRQPVPPAPAADGAARRYVGEVVCLGEPRRWLNWWVGVARDAAQTDASRKMFVGLTRGGYSRHREERRLVVLLGRLNGGQFDDLPGHVQGRERSRDQAGDVQRRQCAPDAGAHADRAVAGNSGGDDER